MSDVSLTRRLLSERWPMDAALSPDGQRLLVTTAEVPLDATDERWRTTVIDLRTGVESPVAAMGEGDHSAAWAPDGSSLAWCTTRDGISMIAVADSTDGPLWLLDGVDRVVGAPVWSPCGTMIVVAAERDQRLDRTQPYRWTRNMLAFDGIGPLEAPPQLRLVDVATGEGRWLTHDQWRWGTPRWSPDGTRLAASTSLDPDGRQSGAHLRIVGIDGTDIAHQVPAGRTVVPAWSSDGRLVVLVAEPRTGKLGGSAALFIVDGDRTTRIDHPDLFGDVYGDNPAVLPELYERTLLADGNGNFFVRTGRRGTMGVARFSLDDTNLQPVVEGQRCCTPVGVAGATLVFTSQSATEPAEIASIEASRSSQPERRVTSFHSFADAAPVRRLEIATAEGWPLDVWFHAPANTSGRVPTVLMIHGGPQFTFGECFQIDVQELVAAGFGVVITNPRGSTGYGDEFAFAVHGDWANGPTRDVLQAVDAVVDRGWADGDRLGVTGLSYGGYLSAWLAATTSRFRAAVIENPVTDLLSMYSTSDIGTTFFPAHFGATPSEAFDLYREQSPLFRAHECDTPCLFVVGEHDRRCPPAQALAMHRVLSERGTPSEVLMLPDSSHEGSTYGPVAGRLAANEALVEWFQRWL